MVFTFVVLLLSAWTFATPTYDQRQNGDVNVEIHLKDVQVVALVDSELLEDYTDYNYSYDYSDFTIKPPAKPSTSSEGSTVSPWDIWPTNPSTSTPKSNFTEEINSNVTESSLIINSTTSLSSDVESTSSSGLTTTKGPDEVLGTVQGQSGVKRNSARCQVDKKGGCKKGLRRRFSFLPFALRMLPKRPETSSP